MDVILKVKEGTVMRKEVPTWVAAVVIVVVLIIVVVALVMFTRPRPITEKAPIEEGGPVTARPGGPMGGPGAPPGAPMGKPQPR